MLTYRVSPEYQGVLDFLDATPDLESWQNRVPQAQCDTERLQSGNCARMDSFLEGEGRPVIIQDAFKGWRAMQEWDLAFFKRMCGHLVVTANDRAPARHADAAPGGGGAQKTLALRLADFVTYVESLPCSLSGSSSTPFYLNGFRAFAEVPALQKYICAPNFASDVDNTVALLEAMDKALFGRAGYGAAAERVNGDATGQGWWHAIDASLTKLFIGPPGTVTRLHFDAGSAHGWLGQVSGRKLFVVYPPSDTQHLYRLDSEKETEQSAIDPLQPDLERFPLYAHARPRAFVLHAGEAVIIPKGWWHYAVALDRSITVQRNFFHAGTNAGGLVEMVMRTLATLRGVSLDQLKHSMTRQPAVAIPVKSMS